MRLFKKDFLNLSPTALGLSAAGFLAPTFALYATKGIALLFAIASVSCIVSLVLKRDTFALPSRYFGLSVLAVIIWGVASMIWTVSLDQSWSVSRSFPFIMLGGILLVNSIKGLDSKDLNWTGSSIISGMFLGLFFALVDTSTGYSISQALDLIKYNGEWNDYMPGFVVNNGITVLVMFFWPVMIFLWNKNRRQLAFIIFIAMIFIISQSTNFSAVVAMGVGAIAFLAAKFFFRAAFRIAAISLAVLILSAPFIMRSLPDAGKIGMHLPELSYSVYPRLVIWQFASARIMEKPIIGHGIRTSRVLDNDSKPLEFQYRDNGQVRKGNTKAIPLHPHNGIIQMWLELGGIGATIGLAIFLSILWGIEKSIAPNATKALAFSALISSMCLISVSYGLWQSWWMGILWLQGALVIASLCSPKKTRPA